MSEDEVHVLLVDDDVTWVRSTAEVLERQREAFTVETATDLEGASVAFAASDPDCVVCDYDLESGTGLDLLAEVREVDDRPFVLITGQGSESVASDAISRQVTDYIPKRSLGGRDDLLARRIETAVEGYRTRLALARERRSKDAMLDILRAAPSREALLGEFCDHLVAERDYACAWIGTIAGTNGIVPQAAAGAERYLDAAIDPGTAPGEGSEPALVALDRRELVVEAVDSGEEDWRGLAAEHGFDHAAAAPITHERGVSGVLAVYRTDAGIDSAERALLEEYGETIGYALRSTEWRESALSATPVSVEIELADPSVPLVGMDNRLPAGSSVEMLTTIPRGERVLYVIRVEGATAEEIHEAAGRVEAVAEVDVTRSGDPPRCELLVSLPIPEAVLADRGGRIVESVVEDGRAAITVVAPTDRVQSLIDGIHGEYPDANVQSVRSDDPAAREATAGDLVESLTDKQRRAIELAFFSGYFERPREHDTTEVAEKFGVSRQTFTQHLRAAERKLLAGVLDPSEG